jgi:two-component system, NtrC family, response regulator AtoC
MKEQVLVIDDEESIRFGLTRLLQQGGYSCLTAGTAAEGFQLFTTHSPSVVLLDLRLPDMEGLEFMKKLKETDKYVSIIIMTAYGTIETAVNALKSGAENFLTKPIDPDGLLVLLRKTLEINEIKRRNDYLTVQEEAKAADYYVGKSEKLRKIHEIIQILSQNDTTVLILGETGTGKGLYARLIHSLSARANHNFVEINCAGFSKELMESELFGYDKGAFTGAVSNKTGLFELANGGTLFLDEIGEMEINVQAKLLKVIEDKRFRRLGGVQEKVVDVRVIAASNRNLAREVKMKSFREDLFYRLNVMPIMIPPLRELREDIFPLAEHFLHLISQKQGKKILGFSTAAQHAISNYPWPGNIREMINLMERSLILCQGPYIEAGDLGLPAPSKGGAVRPAEDTGLFSLEDLEKEHIRKVISASGKNLSTAAKILGITRSTLYSKIKKYGLEAVE